VGQVQLTDLENVMRTYDKSVNLCGRKKEVESESSEESKQDPSVGTGDIELSLSPNADDDIVLAAKQSNAHGFVMGFPRNYETPVGDGSQLVSGGQKQRIAIARAIIKRPSVLLLDEATSALDSVSEKIVEESLQQLQDSRMQTTLVIAHRLTTIKDSDKIVVIDSGNVVEMGKHDELIAHNGLYAALWGKLKSEKAMLDEEKLSSDCAQQ
jgi:ABC-type multidrug transport system fused ATPase/permease subunit